MILGFNPEHMMRKIKCDQACYLIRKDHFMRFRWYILLSLVFLYSCKSNPPDPVPPAYTLTVLYTNDEHGWMEPIDELAGGASGMLGRWNEIEKLMDSDQVLVLSGGDMWTGPAISSWFRGESMVEVMNAMGYDAAAVGNHEFDYGVEGLISNVEKMNFPLLSANMVDKNTGNIPSFVRPYMLIEVGPFDVGIIGLSSLSTPYTGFPAHVESFEFTDYETAVERYATELSGLGADIIIVIGHICEAEMDALVPVAKENNVSLIGGGHCHQIVSKEVDGIALVQTGSYLIGYARVVLEYLPEAKAVTVVSNDFRINKNGYSDDAVDELIAQWRTNSTEELSQKIGYCQQRIEQTSTSMGNLVADSWLHGFPAADVSITNSGGIRQDIPAGDITVETIVGLLPFDNTIYSLELSGDELIDCIGGYLVGGMSAFDGYKLLDGTPIYGDSVYSVLTTDYLYSISSNLMSTYDPDPYPTSVHYRQPLIDWMKSINTSMEDPLDNYLDPVTRQ